ncbi:MAG: hypothetical protein OM95_05445 [Bdellovibrio sp. ArHS]|uniref:ATP-dependent Clp protease proteolytic subunit n=1 Tax=Bdellovibrio sp. ArHS TaxID=1569284 RepID=UPI0005839664|nr:ATP-dependent Clp protease proteolytic subunit [Bdellovibrio sp. ArHS]KHD88922.1 MAG: hypothetical protein OM95_05445 [Bdellovibrio sp. ArHS]
MKLLLKLAAFLPFLILSQRVFAATFEVKEVPRSEMESFFTIKISGEVTPGFAAQLDSEFSKIDPAKEVLLHLNSPGGLVDEGLEAIQIIKQQKEKGRVVETTVENGDKCGSICVPIYVQGKNRYAGEVAAFMFHGARPWHSNIPNKRKTEELLNKFVEAGVSEAWLKKLFGLGVFSEPGEYWVSGKELSAERSNVVTELIPKHVKFKPQRLPIDPNMGPR